MLFVSQAVVSSDESGTQNLGFGFWKCHGEMGLWQVEQGFSSFLAKIFGIFDDFSKFLQHLWHTSLYEITKYAKNLAKNEEKPCSTCLKPISPWHFQNPETWVSGI